MKAPGDRSITRHYKRAIRKAHRQAIAEDQERERRRPVWSYGNCRGLTFYEYGNARYGDGWTCWIVGPHDHSTGEMLPAEVDTDSDSWPYDEADELEELPWATFKEDCPVGSAAWYCHMDKRTVHTANKPGDCNHDDYDDRGNYPTSAAEQALINHLRYLQGQRRPDEWEV